MKNCPVCQATLTFAFKAKILRTHDISYFKCPNCELLKTEKPFWLNDAYKDAIIDADTGLVQRNILIAKKLSGLIYFLLDKNALYLDVAGGYGMLTRLMRDYGYNFYWSDPYCTNVLSRGFEVDAMLTRNFNALTCFEVLEHIENPIEFFQNLILDYKCENIIFSTELYDGKVPDKLWWYYVFEEGQHISFYTKKTLNIISKKLGLNFYSKNGIHFFSKSKINKFKFILATGKLSSLISFFIRKKMNSLTISDHEAIKNINK